MLQLQRLYIIDCFFERTAQTFPSNRQCRPAPLRRMKWYGQDVLPFRQFRSHTVLHYTCLHREYSSFYINRIWYRPYPLLYSCLLGFFHRHVNYLFVLHHFHICFFIHRHHPPLLVCMSSVPAVCPIRWYWLSLEPSSATTTDLAAPCIQV